jgi:hypothetical protein
MKRIIKLTESDLYRIVKRVIKEQTTPTDNIGKFLKNEIPYSFRGLFPIRPDVQNAVITFDNTLDEQPKSQVTKQPINVAGIENGVHFFIKDESEALKSYLNSILTMNLNSLAGKLTLNGKPLEQGRPVDEPNSGPTFYSISNEFNRLIGTLSNSLRIGDNSIANVSNFVDSIPSMNRQQLNMVLTDVENFRKGFETFKSNLTKKGIQGLDLGQFSKVEKFGQAYFGDKMQVYLVLQVDDTWDDQLDAKYVQYRDMIGQQYIEFVKNGIKQNNIFMPSLQTLFRVNPRIKNEMIKGGVELNKLNPEISKLVVIVYSANPGGVQVA